MKKYIYLAFLILFVGVLFTSGVSQARADSCSFINTYLKFGAANDSAEVVKLQKFLNSFELEKLAVTGVFDLPTFQAVGRFQEKYSKEVLAPWGRTLPTGQVYVTTRHKINELYCGEKQAYTAWEKSVLGDNSKPVAVTQTNTTKVVDMNDVDVDMEPASIVKPLSVNPQSTTTDFSAVATTDIAFDDENSASAGTSWVQSVFSSGITLVVLLILLALVIYAMVTNKSNEPPHNPQNKA